MIVELTPDVTLTSLVFQAQLVLVILSNGAFASLKVRSMSEPPVRLFADDLLMESSDR